MVAVLRVSSQIPAYLTNSKLPSRIPVEAQRMKQIRRYVVLSVQCTLDAFLTLSILIAVSSFRKRAVVASLQLWAASAFAPRKRSRLDISPRRRAAAAALLFCTLFAGSVLAPEERGSAEAPAAISACTVGTASEVAQLLRTTSVCVTFLFRTRLLPCRSSVATGPAGCPMSSAAGRQSSAAHNVQNMRHKDANKNTPASGARDSWLETGHVDKRRVRLLTVKAKLPRKDRGKSVVCYLQRDLRVQDNWALSLAHEAAAALRVPLHVVHLLVPALGFQPTPRHIHFFYGGAREVQRELASLNIGFHVPVVTSNVPSGRMKEAKTKIGEIQATLQPAVVVCDFFPLRLATQVVHILTNVCERSEVPLYQVDAHSVVPTWIASNRLEVAARTLRPRLHLWLKEFSTPFPVLPQHPYPPVSSALAAASAVGSAAAPASSSPPSSLLHELPSEEKLRGLLHTEGPAAVEKWTPGAEAGLRQLRQFCCPQQLASYESTRNDPLAGAQSDLSPYLHFGQLSQQRCLLEVLLVKRGGGGGMESSGSTSSTSDHLGGSASSHSSTREVDTGGSNSHYNTERRDSEGGGTKRVSAGRSYSSVPVEDRNNSSRTADPKSSRSGQQRSSRRSSTSNASPRQVNRKDVIIGVDAFIEEAIVRCALSENFVFYSGDTYDRLEGAPLWARESLRQHEKDPRVPLYDMRVLEAAETYDALWNAAQLQLMREGKMHGYLRMYWAKKMLEWMKSPAEALAGAIYLNDKYSLDGTDPNGYVGCMWSIAALHDQPFKERPIFGKVRYMNYAGCQRKFNVSAFLELYGTSSSTNSCSSGTTITRKRHNGSGIKEDSESATRKAKRSGSRGRGDMLGAEVKKIAEKGAERLGKELLTNIIKEQRQQQEEAPAGHEEGSAEKHELDAPPKKANAVKRLRPIKEEDQDGHKPQQLQKHEKERKKGTLQAKLGEKHSERRPKERTKKKQWQA